MHARTSILIIPCFPLYKSTRFVNSQSQPMQGPYILSPLGKHRYPRVACPGFTPTYAIRGKGQANIPSS